MYFVIAYELKRLIIDLFYLFLPSQMPSFELLNNVELFVKHGKFPADATKSCKQVTKAASKKFIFKGIYLHYFICFIVLLCWRSL